MPDKTPFKKGKRFKFTIKHRKNGSGVKTLIGPAISRPAAKHIIAHITDHLTNTGSKIVKIDICKVSPSAFADMVQKIESRFK